MSQNNTPVLGKLPTETDRRDAIHVAIAPVKASYELEPGEHVGVMDDGTFGIVCNPIGVVDPFLKDTVKEGQLFWLCLYPGSVTSLRHVFTHPAFTAKLPIK